MLQQYGQWKGVITIENERIDGRVIVLPMPPSENERLTMNWQKAKEVVAGGYYANFNTKKKVGTLRNSTIYNRWLSASATLLKKGKLPVIEEPVAVFVYEIFPDNLRRDADNRLKGLFDAMTKSGHVWKDDSLVTLFTAEKLVRKGHNFVLAFVVKRNELPKLWIEVKEDFLQQIAENIQKHDADTRAP